MKTKFFFKIAFLFIFSLFLVLKSANHIFASSCGTSSMVARDGYCIKWICSTNCWINEYGLKVCSGSKNYCEHYPATASRPADSFCAELPATIASFDCGISETYGVQDFCGTCGAGGGGGGLAPTPTQSEALLNHCDACLPSATNPCNYPYHCQICDQWGETSLCTRGTTYSACDDECGLRQCGNSCSGDYNCPSDCPCVDAYCTYPPSPTPTPTPTATSTPTATPTSTPTLVPTSTLTLTPTNTPTLTLTPTMPITPSPTPTPACGLHRCSSNSDCPQDCQCCTDFVCPVTCPSPTPTLTETPTPTKTPTLTPTSTLTPTPPACCGKGCSGHTDCLWPNCSGGVCEFCENLTCIIEPTPTPTSTPTPTTPLLPTPTPTPICCPACSSNSDCPGRPDCPAGVCDDCINFSCSQKPPEPPTLTPTPTQTIPPSPTPTCPLRLIDSCGGLKKNDDWACSDNGACLSTEKPFGRACQGDSIWYNCYSWNCTEDSECWPTITNTPTPTKTPAPTITPTPTCIPRLKIIPVCGGNPKADDLTCFLENPPCEIKETPFGYACEDENGNWSNCYSWNCSQDENCLPTPTPAPTQTPLCCISETGGAFCRKEGTEKWPLGAPCPRFCPENLGINESCSTGAGESQRSCRCQAVSFGNFEIGEGQSKNLMVRYQKGTLNNPSSISYRFFAQPELTVSRQSAFKKEAQIIPILSFSWNNYDRFQPAVSGYLDSVSVTIKNDTCGYLNVLVTQDNKNKISDNKGDQDGQLYGGIEKYFNCGPGVPKTKTLTFAFDYLKGYLDKNKTYRLYLLIRGAGETQWNGYEVFVKPHEELTQEQLGYFSDYSYCQGKEECAVRYTAPQIMPPNSKVKLLAETSDSLTVFSGLFGSGNCLGQATVFVPSPTPTPRPLPWFQVQNCDTHANEDLKSPIPQNIAASYLINSSPGGLASSSKKSQEIDLNGSQVSQDSDWKINKYQNRLQLPTFNTIKKQTGILFTDLSKKIPDGKKISELETGLWFTTEDLEIDSQTISGGKNLIIYVGSEAAPKNLTINGNLLTADNSTLFLVVSGKITLLPEVTFLDGAFYAASKIETGTKQPVSNDSPLSIFGSLITGPFGELKLERDLGEALNKTTPAELIICQPRYFVFLSKLFRLPILSWQEVIP